MQNHKVRDQVKNGGWVNISAPSCKIIAINVQMMRETMYYHGVEGQILRKRRSFLSQRIQ